jgi:hypothetical protein
VIGAVQKIRMLLIFILSAGGLDFSVKFLLALSFARPNSYTLSQSSPNCSREIRIILAWSINRYIHHLVIYLRIILQT